MESSVGRGGWSWRHLPSSLQGRKRETEIGDGCKYECQSVRRLWLWVWGLGKPRRTRHVRVRCRADTVPVQRIRHGL